MSSRSDDDPTKRFSTEHYSRVAADLDWSIVLGAASSIFFGFILNITIIPPSYFQFFDNIILLAALYAVTVGTAMFIMPVIYHSAHYHRFDVEKFLLVTKGYVLIGIICVMLAMYLGLGLALDSKLPIQISYSLASLPFIFIFLRFLSHGQKISFDGT
jgi:glucose-6-phosphate-specific signal transduction histidine kinase